MNAINSLKSNLRTNLSIQVVFHEAHFVMLTAVPHWAQKCVLFFSSVFGRFIALNPRSGSKLLFCKLQVHVKSWLVMELIDTGQHWDLEEMRKEMLRRENNNVEILISKHLAWPRFNST